MPTASSKYVMTLPSDLLVTSFGSHGSGVGANATMAIVVDARLNLSDKGHTRNTHVLRSTTDRRRRSPPRPPPPPPPPGTRVCCAGECCICIQPRHHHDHLVFTHKWMRMHMRIGIDAVHDARPNVRLTFSVLPAICRCRWLWLCSRRHGAPVLSTSL